MKNREEYTSIKVIATLLVVIGHIAKFYNEGGGIIDIPSNVFLGSLSKLIYAFHMPLFIFVSGALYSYNLNKKGKYKNVKNFIKKKFKRLMVPYFIWGICYVTPVMVLLGITDLSAKDYVFRCIMIGGDSRHLWYLWTLFCIFLICGIVQLLSLRISKYLLIICIFSLLGIIYLVTRLSPVWNIFYYGIFFFGGYVFDIYKEEIDSKIIAENFVFCIAVGIMGLRLFIKETLILNIFFAMIGIIMIYIFARKYNNKISCMRGYGIFVNDSFGIYLIHPMLIYLIYYFIGERAGNPYIFSVVVLVVVLTVSCLLTETLRKLHCQILLGE